MLTHFLWMLVKLLEETCQLAKFSQKKNQSSIYIQNNCKSYEVLTNEKSVINADVKK